MGSTEQDIRPPTSSGVTDGSQDPPSDRKKRLETIGRVFLFRKSSDQHNEDAKCKGCGSQFLKVKNERLVNHARKCEDLDQDLKQELVAEFEEHMSRKQKRQHSSSLGEHDLEQIQHHRESLLVDLIATNSLPLSLVESSELKEFVGALDPSFKLISRKKLTSTLVPERALSIFNSTISALRKAPRFTLTIEFDGWTSVSGVGLMALVVTTKIGNSALVDLVDISSEMHTGQYLADIACRSIERCGIPLSNFNTIITDEASNFRNARGLIKSKLSATHLLEYRCLAHVYNLIGASISGDTIIKRILRQLVDLISNIDRSQRLVAKLRQLGANRLTHPVPTRWFSTSSAINSALDLKETLELVPKTNEFGYSRWGDTLEDEWFWGILRDLSPYFNRLSSLIGHSEQCDSSLSDSFRKFLEFGKFILGIAGDERRFRAAVLKAYVTHFGRINLDLLLAAYALNPNYRLEFLTERSIRKAKLYMLTLLFEMGHDEEAGRVLTREFGQFLQKMKATTTVINDVHSWWESSGSAVLKIIGARLAACHASSANTERIFSGLGRIITPARNRLNIKTVFELMCIRIHNLARNSVRARRERRSSAPASDPSLEHGMERLSLGGFDSEAGILDPRYEVDDHSEQDSEALFQSTAYLEFKSFIDFDLKPLDGINAETESLRRSSDQRARELLESLERDNQSQ